MQEVTRAKIKNRKTKNWVNVWLRDGLHCCWAVVPRRTEQRPEADRRINTKLPPHKIWFKPNKA